MDNFLELKKMMENKFNILISAAILFTSVFYLWKKIKRRNSKKRLNEAGDTDLKSLDITEDTDEYESCYIEDLESIEDDGVATSLVNDDMGHYDIITDKTESDDLTNSSHSVNFDKNTTTFDQSFTTELCNNFKQMRLTSPEINVKNNEKYTINNIAEKYVNVLFRDVLDKCDVKFFDETQMNFTNKDITVTYTIDNLDREELFNNIHKSKDINQIEEPKEVANEFKILESVAVTEINDQEEVSIEDTMESLRINNKVEDLLKAVEDNAIVDQLLEDSELYAKEKEFREIIDNIEESFEDNNKNGEIANKVGESLTSDKVEEFLVIVEVNDKAVANKEELLEDGEIVDKAEESLIIVETSDKVEESLEIAEVTNKVENILEIAADKEELLEDGEIADKAEESLIIVVTSDKVEESLEVVEVTNKVENILQVAVDKEELLEDGEIVEDVEESLIIVDVNDKVEESLEIAEVIDEVVANKEELLEDGEIVEDVEESLIIVDVNDKVEESLKIAEVIDEVVANKEELLEDGEIVKNVKESLVIFDASDKMKESLEITEVTNKVENTLEVTVDKEELLEDGEIADKAEESLIIVDVNDKESLEVVKVLLEDEEIPDKVEECQEIVDESDKVKEPLEVAESNEFEASSAEVSLNNDSVIEDGDSLDSLINNMDDYFKQVLSDRCTTVVKENNVENWQNDPDSLNNIKRDFYELPETVCSPHPSSESEHAHCVNNLTERVATHSAESILDNLHIVNINQTPTISSPLYDEGCPELYVEKINFQGKEMDIVYFDESLLEECGVVSDVRIVRTIPVGIGGRIIGKKGKTKNELLKKFGADLLIYNHPSEHCKQVLQITCSPALKEQLEKWADKTLDQILKNTIQTTVSNPEWLKPMVPLGKMVMVQIIDMPTIQHIKLRLYDPKIIKTYNKMQAEINVDYSQADANALLPSPVAVGCICIAMIRPDYFLRAEIICIYDQYAIVYLYDLGKTHQTCLFYLFKIREKYMKVPFQVIPARMPHAVIKNKLFNSAMIHKRFLCDKTISRPQMVRAFFPRMNTCCEPCVHIYISKSSVDQSNTKDAGDCVDLLELLVSIDVCSMVKETIDCDKQLKMNENNFKHFLSDKEKKHTSLTTPMYFEPCNSRFYEDFLDFQYNDDNNNI